MTDIQRLRRILLVTKRADAKRILCMSSFPHLKNALLGLGKTRFQCVPVVRVSNSPLAETSFFALHKGNKADAVEVHRHITVDKLMVVAHGQLQVLDPLSYECPARTRKNSYSWTSTLFRDSPVTRYNGVSQKPTHLVHVKLRFD